MVKGSKKTNGRQQKRPQRLPSVASLARQLQSMRTRPKAKPSRQRIMSGPMDSAGKYTAALLHPFAKQAEGARVPEPFAISSVVHKAHSSFVLTTNTSQSFDCVVNCHPLLTCMTGVGTVSGGLPATVTNLPAGITARGSASATFLESTYKSYRVVAWGVRIKGLTNFANNSGRIYVAVVPASQQIPLLSTVGATKQQFYEGFDAPYDTTGGGLPTNLLALPRSRQFAISEIMAEGGIELTLPICSPAAKNFNEGQNQTKEQGLTVANGAGAVTGLMSFGYASCSGHSQVFIYGEGMGATGVNTDILSLDVIMHVEGIPNISATNGGLAPATPFVAPPAGPGAEHRAHAKVAVAPIFRSIAEKAKEEVIAFGQKKITDYFKKSVGTAEKMFGIMA